jgi:LEA14-like dessication related protein
MNTFFKYCTILLFVFSLSSCLEYKEVEVIKIVEIGVKEISVKGVDVEVAMQVKNPNNYNISIVDSDLNLLIKGKKMGSATIKEKVTLKKKSTAVYRFTLQSSFKDLSLSSLPVLMSIMGQNSMEVQIVGDIKAQAKGISKRVPIDFTEKVKL